MNGWIKKLCNLHRVAVEKYDWVRIGRKMLGQSRVGLCLSQIRQGFSSIQIMQNRKLNKNRIQYLGPLASQSERERLRQVMISARGNEIEMIAPGVVSPTSQYRRLRLQGQRWLTRITRQSMIEKNYQLGWARYGKRAGWMGSRRQTCENDVPCIGLAC